MASLNALPKAVQVAGSTGMTTGAPVPVCCISERIASGSASRRVADLRTSTERAFAPRRRSVALLGSVSTLASFDVWWRERRRSGGTERRTEAAMRYRFGVLIGGVAVALV